MENAVLEKPEETKKDEKLVIELEVERSEEGDGLRIFLRSDVLEDFFIKSSSSAKELREGGRVEDYCGVFKLLKTKDGKNIYFPKLKHPIMGISGSYDRPLIEANLEVNTFILTAMGTKEGLEIVCPGMFTKDSIEKIKDVLKERAEKMFRDYIQLVRVEIKVLAREIF